MVRATSPGTFTLPGATIEDMYRPELRANTDAGTIAVEATGGPADESPATPEDSTGAAAP
jgi:hypothetical protein